MRILIVDNVTPESRHGNDNIWMQEAVNAYGRAAEEEFEVILGLDEDGATHIIKDSTGEVVDAECASA